MILNNNRAIIEKLMVEVKKQWQIEKTQKGINFIKNVLFNLSNQKNDAEKYILLFIYEYFSHESIRDRKVTSREFEDFLSLLLDAEVADEQKRENEEIDKNLENKMLKLYPDIEKAELREILIDLATNKREKADLILKGESDLRVSVKTLKGFSLCDYYIKNYLDKEISAKKFIDAYCKEYPLIAHSDLKLAKSCQETRGGPDCENIIKFYKKIREKLKPNLEMNIGALSYRALFKNIEENLGDRKNGLGSRRQMVELFKKIKKNGDLEKFTKRLEIFLDYLYGDEIFFIAYKSGIRMQIFVFEGKKLNKLLIELLKQCEECFAGVFHRWENNNLRLNIKHLISNGLWQIGKAAEYQPVQDFSFELETGEAEGKKVIKCSVSSNPFDQDNLIIIDFKKILDDQEFIGKIKKIQEENIENLLKKITARHWID